MTTLKQSLNHYGTPEFNNTLKNEVLLMEASQLPLQQALTQSSYVSNTAFSVVILNSRDNALSIVAKVGVFYFGIIAGSCCADDPTPVDELQEYCELEFIINKETGEAEINLLN